MNIYKAVLIATFGHGSLHPKRAAAARIALCTVAALGLGIFFATQIGGGLMPSAHSRPELFFVALACLQLSLVATMAISAGVMRDSHDRLSGILQQLPVKPWSLYICKMIPKILLAFWCLALVTPGAILVLSSLGLPWWTVPPSITLSILFAIGISSVFEPGSNKLTTLAAAIACYVQFIGAKHIMQSEQMSDGIYYSLLALAALSITTAIGWNTRASRATGPRAILRRFPDNLWHLKQLVRSRRIQFGLGFTFSIALAISVWGYRNQLDSSFYSTVCMLLAASFCADIRSITRRYKPPESPGMYGTYYFIQCNLLVAIIVGGLSILPIVITGVFSEGYTVIAAGFLGVVSGWFAGVALVPKPRDISAQFGAVIVAIGLVLFPSVTGLERASQSLQAVTLVSIGLVLVFLAFRIECKRNPYIWRRHD